MSDLDMAVPLTFTDAAANKVKSLISEEENNELKLRVYITGGGCSGFQYGFTFDDKVNEGDLTIEKAGVQLVIDPMSLQYLIGGTVDYTCLLYTSKSLFSVRNDCVDQLQLDCNLSILRHCITSLYAIWA